MWESESIVSEHTATPDMWSAVQEAHFFIVSPRLLRWSAQLRGWDSLGVGKRGPYPTNCSAISIRKTAMIHLCCLSYWSPNGPGCPNTPHASLPFSSGWVPKSTCADSECKYFTQIAGLDEGPHTGHYLKENQQEAPSLALQDQKKALKNSSSEGNKRCGVEESIEKVWETLRIPNQADWWRHFLPKASQ